MMKYLENLFNLESWKFGVILSTICLLLLLIIPINSISFQDPCMKFAPANMILQDHYNNNYGEQVCKYETEPTESYHSCFKTIVSTKEHGYQVTHDFC